MSTTSQTPNAGTRKDIFISYSRRDKPWVDSYLTPLLDAANLDFAIDDQDLPIGAPLKESIRELIKECRYTLLVMTPDWVQGKWTNYELELAAQDKPDDDSVHVLALKLKECDVPPNIAPNLYLDISQARTRDIEIVKLLRQLDVPEDKIENAKASVAKKPRWFLIELLTEPRIRDQMSEVEHRLGRIRRSNDILTTNKTLHDRLQELEFPLRQLTGLFADRNFLAAEQSDWKQVWGATSALCEKLELLVDFAAQVPDDLVDVHFVAPFQSLAGDIKAAFLSRDGRLFCSYVNVISRQIDRSLPRVNDRIVQHVKERRLSDLVQNLQTIYELVADIEFDEDVIGLLSQFRTNIDELVELERAIQKEVDDHETLQNAEVTLHLCNPDDEPTFYVIHTHWNRVNAFVNDLKLTDRYGTLLGCSQQLCEQLGNDEIVRDDGFEESVKWNFTDFVHEMRKSFNKLDIDLLADCEKLKPRSDELNELLTRMQDYDI